MHEDIIPKKEIDGRLVALLIGVMAEFYAVMHEDIIPKKAIDGRLVALLIGVMVEFYVVLHQPLSFSSCNRS